MLRADEKTRHLEKRVRTLGNSLVVIRTYGYSGKYIFTIVISIHSRKHERSGTKVSATWERHPNMGSENFEINDDTSRTTGSLGSEDAL